MKTAAWRTSVLRALPRSSLVQLARACSMPGGTAKRELVARLAERWRELGDASMVSLLRTEDLRCVAVALDVEKSGDKAALVERVLACPFRTFADARRYASSLRLAHDAAE